MFNGLVCNSGRRHITLNCLASLLGCRIRPFFFNAAIREVLHVSISISCDRSQ